MRAMGTLAVGDEDCNCDRRDVVWSVRSGAGPYDDKVDVDLKR
jgi:hypothetical protein